MKEYIFDHGRQMVGVKDNFQGRPVFTIYFWSNKDEDWLPAAQFFEDEARELLTALQTALQEEPFVPERPTEFEKAMDKLVFRLRDLVEQLTGEKGLNADETTKRIADALQAAQEQK